MASPKEFWKAGTGTLSSESLLSLSAPPVGLPPSGEAAVLSDLERGQASTGFALPFLSIYERLKHEISVRNSDGANSVRLFVPGHHHVKNFIIQKTLHS